MIRFHPALDDLLVDIDDLQPHPQNPNNGDTDAIAESIQVNGYYAPVVVQRSTNRIVVGNHRYAAMMQLGATKIPAIYLDLDDEQALRVMVVDNRTTRLGRDDEGLLLDLLTVLSQTDLELLGTGYDSIALDRLREVEHEIQTPPPDDHIFTCPACGHSWTRS